MIVLLALSLFIKYSLSFQEIFTLDCQRRAHIFPELPYATGIDVSGYMSIMNAALNEMYEQSKVVCPEITDEEFNNRFGLTLPQGLVRLFELEKFPENECENRYYMEISTYYNYIKGLLPEDPLPYSCSQEAADEGRCHFAIELKPFTLQFAIEECPPYPGEEIYNRIPFLSVTCDGCETFLKPCTDDSDCGDDMLCELYEDSYGRFYAWFKDTKLGGELVLREEDFFDFGWFDDLMKKSLRGYEFVTEFFHSVSWNYWGSGFFGMYDAYKFCFPDIAYGSDLFLGLYDIEDCDDSQIPDDFYCKLLFTDPDVCSGNGDCVQKECRCDEGWVGQLCEVEEQDHIFCFGVWEGKLTEVCSTHGTCVAEDTCECEEGWMGDECERVAQCNGFDYYDPRSCGDHGTCVEDGVCVCEAFYFTRTGNGTCRNALKCGMDEQYWYGPYGCNYNGLCLDTGDDTGIGECECSYGWDGPTCGEYLECDGYVFNNEFVCHGRGFCLADGTCDCNDGFGGDYCEDDNQMCGMFYHTQDLVCNEHGDCVWHEELESYACDCDEGYFSSYYYPHCQGILTCFNVLWNMGACGGNGECVDEDVCVCNTYWTGEQCLEPILCNGVFGEDSGVCSGNGECTIDGKCVSDEQHFGDDCEYLMECGGYSPYDPEVCDGTGVCTVDGCKFMEIDWFETEEDGETNQDCMKQLLHIVSPWEGNLENNDMVNSPSRLTGQYFYTQINRVRMEYDPEKPVPLFIYNGDGVFTFLPSHKYLGFAVYLKDLDRLLVLVDELFSTLREFHTDITDVLQQFYYKIWDPMPWLFRFTSYNIENHLNWRVNHWDKNVVRFLKGYELPRWFKLIEPPMTCTLKTFEDSGNCTIRFTSLKRFFGNDFDLYVRFRRDEKNSVTDYTGFPHIEVWCGGVLCHEMYNLKRCEDNLDCDSEHCKTILQTYDYREETYVTPIPLYEIVEDDGTTFTYNAKSLSSLFFEGSYFRMDFSSDMIHPLVFFKKMHAYISGAEYVEDTEEDLNVCILDRKDGMRARHGKYRHWKDFWNKLSVFFDGLWWFESVDNWWKKHKNWWKEGWDWDDDDDDDNDDGDDWDWDWNWGDDDDDKEDGDDWDWDWDWDRRQEMSSRRGWWTNWWKKKKKERKKKQYVMKVKGLESWNNLFCMKQGGDECGCAEGMVNCICYEYSENECEHYFHTPQELVEVLPGIEYIPPPPDPDDQDDESDDSSDDSSDDNGDDDGDDNPPNTLNPNSAAVLVICGLVFGLALIF